MKRAQFMKPGSLVIERAVNREGPKVTYTVWKPNSSRIFRDSERKELLKFCAWPKSTKTGMELREWLDSFKEDVPEERNLDMAKIKETGWGPEAHAEEEPNDNTKMVT